MESISIPVRRNGLRKLQPNAHVEHLRRVAAWSVEIVRARSGQQLARTAESLLNQAASGQESLAAVQSFIRQAAGNGPDPDLPLILERCDELDKACELDAYFGRDPHATEDMLDILIGEAASVLRCVPLGAIEQAAMMMPVAPAVGQLALALIGRRNVTLSELEDVLSEDQTLAGCIVAASNSATYGHLGRVATIRAALARLGLVRARRLVCAAMCRRMFDASVARDLWNHSLTVAGTAARIASDAQASIDEAFLSGLVHDIGRLALLGVPGEAQNICRRLTQRGCPQTIVERVVFGEDHAALGARLLRRWNFAARIVEAVKAHHEPEHCDSAMAGILYLAERTHMHDRDLESARREVLALKAAGVRANYDEWRSATDDGGLASLRFAVAA